MDTEVLKNLPQTVEEFMENSKAYETAIAEAAMWKDVPLVNYTPEKHLIPLMRFRGMVQDMQNPEFYLERYEVREINSKKTILRNGKYIDSIAEQPDEHVEWDAAANVLSSRRALVVVAVPYLNCWALNYEQEFNNVNLKNNEKSQQMDVDGEDQIMKGLTEPVYNNCKVYLYDKFEEFPLHSLIEALGFLTLVDKVPHLHAIAVHALPHNNPLLDRHFHSSEINEDVDAFNMSAVYKELHNLLKMTLFNDDIAAHYLLCHLISNVNNNATFRNVKKFCLNICNFPEEAGEWSESNIKYTEQFYKLLELLLPVSHYLPMDLNTMNTAKLLPKKDYDKECIERGLLQLSPNTHLVLDETRMQPGVLNENGLDGMRALTVLVNEQEISYDFQVYQMNYNVNVPVLVLSEGRSLLPRDFIVALELDDKSDLYKNETLTAAHHYLQTANRIEKFRRYLTLARLADNDISDAASQFIENDFVEMRRSKTIDMSELHNLIVLARLLCKAHGEKSLNKEYWELAKTFEEERKKRLSKLCKSKSVANRIQ